jgi:hypothetical protein
LKLKYKSSSNRPLKYSNTGYYELPTKPSQQQSVQDSDGVPIYEEESKPAITIQVVNPIIDKKEAERL